MDIAAPFGCVRDTAEVSIADDQVGFVACYVTAGNAHANVGLKEGLGVGNSITSHRNDTFDLLQRSNEHLLVNRRGPMHDDSVCDRSVEMFFICI